MANSLDYAKVERRPVARWLARGAHVALWYPLILLAGLYGEFFLAWALLGHRPWPMMDDPKEIAGSNWLHPLVLMGGAGLFPGVAGAVTLNVVYMVRARLRGMRLAGQIAGFVLVWLGAFVLLAWDPGRVVEWWLD